MEIGKEIKSALEKFVERIGKGEGIDAKIVTVYESAAEVEVSFADAESKMIYPVLYNGHFWDQAHAMLAYLGPNPKLAALNWLRQYASPDEADFNDDEENILEQWEDAANEADYIDDEDEDDPFQRLTRLYNPLRASPRPGDPIMPIPEEWNEKLKEKRAKWVRMDIETGEQTPAFSDNGPEGFAALVARMQEIFGTRVMHKTYRDDEFGEYACEVYLGYRGEGDDEELVTAYLVKIGNAYYDTNSGALLSVLGCSPKLAAERFCNGIGAYYFDDDEDELFHDDLDNHNAGDPNNRFIIPEEWTEVMRQGQAEAEAWSKRD